MIICILGRGASGKDTLKNKLKLLYQLKELPLFTTRPQRPGEDVNSYIWGENVNGDILCDLDVKANENCAEIRKYKTVHGDWYYGTLSPTVKTIYNETIELYNIKENNYLVVTAPQQLKNYVEAFGKEDLFLIYLNCPRHVCEERIMKRDKIDIEEASRRLESDDKDFSIDEINKIKDLGLNTLTLFPSSDTQTVELIASLVSQYKWKELHLLETS